MSKKDLSFRNVTMKTEDDYDQRIIQMNYERQNKRDRQPYTDTLTRRLKINLRKRREVYGIFSQNLKMITEEYAFSRVVFEANEEVEKFFDETNAMVLSRTGDDFYIKYYGSVDGSVDGSVMAENLKSAANIVLTTKEVVFEAASAIARKKGLSSDSEEKLAKIMMGESFLMIAKEENCHVALDIFLHIGSGGEFTDYEVKEHGLDKLGKEDILKVFNAMDILPESRHRLAKDNTQFPARLIALNKEKLSIKEITELGERLLEIKQSAQDPDAKNPEKSESMKQIAKMLKTKIKAEERSVDSGNRSTVSKEEMDEAVSLIKQADPKYKTAKEKAEEKAAKSDAKQRGVTEKPSGIVGSVTFARLSDMFKQLSGGSAR